MHSELTSELNFSLDRSPLLYIDTKPRYQPDWTTPEHGGSAKAIARSRQARTHPVHPALRVRAATKKEPHQPLNHVGGAFFLGVSRSWRRTEVCLGLFDIETTHQAVFTNRPQVARPLVDCDYKPHCGPGCEQLLRFLIATSVLGFGVHRQFRAS